jgi:hypothetical protein
MPTKQKHSLILALYLALCLAAGPLHAAQPRLLFQTSTLQALLAGAYNGEGATMAVGRPPQFLPAPAGKSGVLLHGFYRRPAP